VPLIPKPTTGYPIVGYTNWQVATCLATTDGNDVVGFLKDHFNAAGSTSSTLIKDVTLGGFVPVSGASVSAAPTGFASAIVATFLTSSSSLGINNTSVCTAANTPNWR
jgi:hypothetical protein